MTTNRPPFRRNKSRKTGPGRKKNKASPSGSNSTKSNPFSSAKLLRRLRGLILLVVIFCVVDFINTGTISWPQNLYEKITGTLKERATGEDAGWREVTEAVEKMGEKKEGRPAPAFDFTGRVVRVADGDTVSVLDANRKQHKVRLYGIDTPERDQAHGQQSRRALERLVADKKVGVVVVETDDYGRTVGTIYRGDKNINAAMVASGDAWWYRHYAPHSRRLAAAEENAREKGLGLWGSPNPIPPWDWRRSQR